MAKLIDAATFRGKIGQARMADGFTGPSYFIAELDGDTAPTRRLAAQWEQERLDAEAEYDAEMAFERHLETNDQYRWEVEQDERIAAMNGGYSPRFR